MCWCPPRSADWSESEGELTVWCSRKTPQVPVNKRFRKNKVVKTRSKRFKPMADTIDAGTDNDTKL